MLGPSHTPLGCRARPAKPRTAPASPGPPPAPTPSLPSAPAWFQPGLSTGTLQQPSAQPRLPATPGPAGPLRGWATVLAAPPRPAPCGLATWRGESALGPSQPFLPNTSRKTPLRRPSARTPGLLRRWASAQAVPSARSPPAAFWLHETAPSCKAQPKPLPLSEDSLKRHRVPWV